MVRGRPRMEEEMWWRGKRSWVRWEENMQEFFWKVAKKPKEKQKMQEVKLTNWQNKNLTTTWWLEVVFTFESDHILRVVLKMRNRMWPLFKLGPLPPFTSHVCTLVFNNNNNNNNNYLSLYGSETWSHTLAMLATQTKGEKPSELFVGDFIVIWNVFVTEGTFIDSYRREGMCDFKMCQSLFVLKCKIGTIMFHQRWLLVWVHKDLLRATVTTAERNAASFLLFSRFFPLFLLCEGQPAASTTSENPEECENKTHTCLKYVVQFWFTKNTLYCFYIYVFILFADRKFLLLLFPVN